MPSNSFATTGTNVSILFIDATNKEEVILIDASGLEEKIKEGKNPKTVLHEDDELEIIETFNAREAIDDFSVAVSYDEIEAKYCSLSAGQYFVVKIEHIDISEDEFDAQMDEKLNRLFAKSFTEQETAIEVNAVKKNSTTWLSCRRNHSWLCRSNGQRVCRRRRPVSEVTECAPVQI